MPLEIEAKLQVRSFDHVRNALLAIGASQLGVVLETNLILDDHAGILRRTGRGLRIRSAAPLAARETDKPCKSTVTFKGPAIPGRFKNREEHEFEVDDANAAQALFTGLGYVTVLEYQKKRETWRVEDCLVELDEPADLGRFVEIEGPTEDAVVAVQQRLGLGDSDHLNTSYVTMAMDHCSRNGIDPPILRL